MTRLEGIRPGGRGEIASSNLSRRRATRRKKRSERGEKVRRQSGRFFNRLAGGGGERARQTLVQLVVVCVHFVVGPPSALSHSQSMCRLPRQLPAPLYTPSAPASLRASCSSRQRRLTASRYPPRTSRLRDQSLPSTRPELRTSSPA